MVIDKVIAQASEINEKAGGLTVTDLRVGVKYIAVELSDGRCGISFRFDPDPFHMVVREPRAIQYRNFPVSDLIRWAADNRSLERSGVGIAVCNALTPWDEMEGVEQMDSAEAAGIRDGDIVGMIGFFPPLVKMLEKRDIELRVFERGFKQPQSLPLSRLGRIPAPSRMRHSDPDRNFVHKRDPRSAAVMVHRGPRGQCNRSVDSDVPRAYEGTNATILAGARYKREYRKELFDAISAGSCGSELLEYLDKFAFRL